MMAYFTDAYQSLSLSELTHWGQVTHICVGNLTIIGSDNDIIWTRAVLLSIGPLGTNSSQIAFKIRTFSFNKNAF